MNPYAELVSEAKARVDNGFSQVGRGLKSPAPAQRTAAVLAARAIALGNAVAALAGQGLAREGLPLLRELLEAAVCLRWIAAGSQDSRARRVLEEWGRVGWEGLWRDGELRIRAREGGVPDGLVEEVLSSTRAFRRPDASGLPWGHVFAEDAAPVMAAEDLLRRAADLSGHVVKALDQCWPGCFEGAERIWEKTR